MERLTAKRAETLRKPGRYQAGDTVYLVVARGRTGRVNKRWVQRLHVQGKRRDISIGTYPAVTLSEARERAHDNRLTASGAATRPGSVDRADVRGRVGQGRARGPVARPDARDAAADAGAVCDPVSLATLVQQRVAALQFPLEATVNSLYDDGLTAMTACTFHIYLD